MTTIVLNRPEEKLAVDLPLEEDEIALINLAPLVNVMSDDDGLFDDHER